MTDSTTTAPRAADRLPVLRELAELVKMYAEEAELEPDFSDQDPDYQAQRALSNFYNLFADYADQLPVDLLAAGVKVAELMIEVISEEICDECTADPEHCQGKPAGEQDEPAF